jgi:hypothetical protein
VIGQHGRCSPPSPLGRIGFLPSGASSASEAYADDSRAAERLSHECNGRQSRVGLCCDYGIELSLSLVWTFGSLERQVRQGLLRSRTFWRRDHSRQLSPELEWSLFFGRRSGTDGDFRRFLRALALAKRGHGITSSNLGSKVTSRPAEVQSGPSFRPSVCEAVLFELVAEHIAVGARGL